MVSRKTRQEKSCSHESESVRWPCRGRAIPALGSAIRLCFTPRMAIAASLWFDPLLEDNIRAQWAKDG
jgi:hypothetical protein